MVQKDLFSLLLINRKVRVRFVVTFCKDVAQQKSLLCISNSYGINLTTKAMNRVILFKYT